MIPILLGWIAASPSMRIALRYGAIAIALLLFLLSIRRAFMRFHSSPSQGKSSGKL